MHCNRMLHIQPKSLDQNKRIIKEFFFLFHPSPPLFCYLAAVRVSPWPAMYHAKETSIILIFRRFSISAILLNEKFV